MNKCACLSSCNEISKNLILFILKILFCQEPMSKFRKLSISSFKGDKGWKLRDTYSDLVKDIERYCFPQIFCYSIICAPRPNFGENVRGDGEI